MSEFSAQCFCVTCRAQRATDEIEVRLRADLFVMENFYRRRPSAFCRTCNAVTAWDRPRDVFVCAVCRIDRRVTLPLPLPESNPWYSSSYDGGPSYGVQTIDRARGEPTWGAATAARPAMRERGLARQFRRLCASARAALERLAMPG